MIVTFEEIKTWVASIAGYIENNAEPDPQFLSYFTYEPQCCFYVLEILNSLDDNEVDEEPSFYSACIVAIDICVAQLQTARENHNKTAAKTMDQLMSRLAQVIREAKHSVSFWLPILNAFYDVHAELSEDLREAYLELAGQDEELIDDGTDQLEAIRGLIEEHKGQSVFAITDSFFAQSYAMPVDFFIDLVFDLYGIREGQEIALLLLLHPQPAVRQLVIAAHEEVIEQVQFSSISLSRLQIIQSWYGIAYYEQFNRWIKIQRKKGVTFAIPQPGEIVSVKASEVDGSGAQGIFIRIKLGQKSRLCGLLLKYDVGIKDVWVTPQMTAKDISQYYKDAFDDSVTLKEVDLDYLSMIINHYLAISLAKHEIPQLHFLEMLELTGLQFQPQLLNLNDIITQLGVQIAPFTAESMQASFKRSKGWLSSKRFTESWYIENARVDKLVNRHSSFVDGVRVCVLQEAMDTLFEQEFEENRDRWLFHFIWTTLWLRSHKKKNDKQWQDSFFIAHAIFNGLILKEIPVMVEIVKQTIANSIETMNERKTYLNQE